LDSNEKNDSFRKEIENIIKKLNEISSEESKKKAQRLEKLLKRNSNLELVFELAKNY
jgi:thiaminase